MVCELLTRSDSADGLPWPSKCETARQRSLMPTMNAALIHGRFHADPTVGFEKGSDLASLLDE
jgi:hypothetical protein